MPVPNEARIRASKPKQKGLQGLRRKRRISAGYAIRRAVVAHAVSLRRGGAAAHVGRVPRRTPEAREGETGGSEAAHR